MIEKNEILEGNIFGLIKPKFSKFKKIKITKLKFSAKSKNPINFFKS